MLINQYTIQSAVDLLKTEYDGSKTNQYARYKAVTLLDKWVKQLIVFAELSHTQPESFYNHLWNIIAGYQVIIRKEQNSENYQMYIHEIK